VQKFEHPPVLGDQLPALTFGPVSRTTLALYAGASGDHNPIHIDSDFARAAGVGDVFAHGMLSMAQVGRVVTDWAGIERLVSLSVRFLAITHVGDEIICSGEVVETFERDGAPHVRVVLKAQVQRDHQTIVGEAVVRTQ